jgi:hypothetical protein
VTAEFSFNWKGGFFLMDSHGFHSFKWFLLGFIGFSILIPAAARADLETFETDLGRFATWDSEVGTLTAVQDGAAGYSGGGMILSNGGTTAIGVENYTVLPNTFYMVTAWIQVQSGGSSPFSFTVAVKSGSSDAANLNTTPGTWFLPGAWEYGADDTAETQWPEDENGWKIIGMSVRTGVSDTALSLGFALDGSGAPAVHVDDVHVTQPSAALVYGFDEAGYITFDYANNGYHYDGSHDGDCGDPPVPNVDLGGVVPSDPADLRLYVPGWMCGGVGDGLTDSSRETGSVYDGAAWRMDHPGGQFDDGSPVLPLVTTPDTIYTANFWMVRDRESGGNAWVNWNNQYETHVAWRLADDPSPGDIEGWPGAIRPNAFHVICEGASNSERNYAPDIYAPGSGTTIDCVDPTGSRYSTMAYQAADDTSWFEACLRSSRGADNPTTGWTLWIMDDFRLLQHGEEDLLASLISGVDGDTLKNYR